MADDKVVFREAITNILDAHRSRLSPKARERLRLEAGVDEAATRPLYPLAAHDMVVKILAEELYPGQPVEEATFQVGRTLMSDYGKGPLGRALFSLIRLIGPIRILKRVPGYYRLNNNYVDVKIEVLTDTSYLLDHNEVGSVPHYWRGTMQGSGEVIGLPNHSVELLSYDGQRAKYKISW